MAAYPAKFVNLERFAPTLVATENMQANRFFEGLIYPTRKRLATMKYKTWDKVVSVTSRDVDLPNVRQD